MTQGNIQQCGMQMVMLPENNLHRFLSTGSNQSDYLFGGDRVQELYSFLHQEDLSQLAE